MSPICYTFHMEERTSRMYEHPRGVAAAAVERVPELGREEASGA